MMALSLVAVPVLLDTNTDAALLLKQWARLYHYGHQLAPALAVTSLAFYGYTARGKYTSQKPWCIWATAGLVTISMVPFTWIAMVPTNNTLFELGAQRGVELRGAQDLMVKWSWLHVMRSLFPLFGAITGWVGLMGDS